MPYSADINRTNPSCFLFLVVQCIGMDFDMPGMPGYFKGQVAADAVNRIVDTLAQRCSQGMEVRDYFHIGIMGFSCPDDRTNSMIQNTFALPGTTSKQPFLPISQVVQIADMEERQVRENYGNGEIVEVTRRFPVWLRHFPDGGWDPMRQMLELMERPLAEWVGQHPTSYPPTVVIVCDGWATDGDPYQAAERLKSLRTNDGNVLLYAVHLSSAEGAIPTVFPSRENGLPSMGEATDDSKMMFRMASVLPETTRQQAVSLGFSVDDGSRGLILNADAVALAQFLDIGTRGPSNLH